MVKSQVAELSSGEICLTFTTVKSVTYENKNKNKMRIHKVTDRKCNLHGHERIQCNKRAAAFLTSFLQNA